MGLEGSKVQEAVWALGWTGVVSVGSPVDFWTITHNQVTPME